MVETELILIRHAEAVPSAEISEADWPLSETGQRHAVQLVSVLAQHDVAAVFSSPYRRAIDTVRPFANAHGHDIHIHDDLRERTMSDRWIPDFSQVIDLVHGDPNAALPGGETANQACDRFEQALTSIARVWCGWQVAVATHGSVIAHLMRRHHGELPSGYFFRIARPHLFHVHSARIDTPRTGGQSADRRPMSYRYWVCSC